MTPFMSPARARCYRRVRTPRQAEGMCVMEAVAYVAGEPHSDEPVCACRSSARSCARGMTRCQTMRRGRGSSRRSCCGWWTQEHARGRTAPRGPRARLVGARADADVVCTGETLQPHAAALRGLAPLTSAAACGRETCYYRRRGRRGTPPGTPLDAAGDMPGPPRDAAGDAAGLPGTPPGRRRGRRQAAAGLPLWLPLGRRRRRRRCRCRCRPAADCRAAARAAARVGAAPFGRSVAGVRARAG